jgi:hypothetical protein
MIYPLDPIHKVIRLLIEAGAKTDSTWLGFNAQDLAVEMGQVKVQNVFRAYTSQFRGNIVGGEGVKCTASWPGIYAKLWDHLVDMSKQNELSAAVVFLPEHTRWVSGLQV